MENKNINEKYKNQILEGIAKFSISEYYGEEEYTLELYEDILKDLKYQYKNNEEIGIAATENENNVERQLNFDLDDLKFKMYLDNILVHEKEWDQGCFIDYLPDYNEIIQVDATDDRLEELGFYYDEDDILYNEKEKLLDGIAEFYKEDKGLTLQEATNQVRSQYNKSGIVNIIDKKTEAGIPTKIDLDINKKEFTRYLNEKVVSIYPWDHQGFISYSPEFDNYNEFLFTNQQLEKAGMGYDKEKDKLFVKENSKYQVQKNIPIKFLNNSINEYKTKDIFDNHNEITKYRIRFPEESEYKDFSLDTKIEPLANNDGLTSYMYVDPNFKYKAIAPGIEDTGELNWNMKQEISIKGSDLKREFNKGNLRVDKRIEEIKKKDVGITFLNTNVNSYKFEDKLYGRGEVTKYRIRFPEESIYKDFSIDTKIKPINNKDQVSSFIYIDPKFEYKAVAPGIDDKGKLDWNNKQEIKLSGSELKVHFDKGKEKIKSMAENNKEKYNTLIKEEVGKDIKKEKNKSR